MCILFLSLREIYIVEASHVNEQKMEEYKIEKIFYQQMLNFVHVNEDSPTNKTK